MIDQKQCSRCREIKSFDEFSKDKYKKEGHCNQCKECQSNNFKKYRLNNKDKLTIRSKKWRIENPTEYRNHKLKYLYNISFDQYNTLLIKQNNRCIGCNKHELECKNKLSVDHNHKCCPGVRSCGKCIRGLLCSQYNHALGLLSDNIQTLQNLINYLKNNGLIN